MSKRQPSVWSEDMGQLVAIPNKDDLGHLESVIVCLLALCKELLEMKHLFLLRLLVPFLGELQSLHNLGIQGI